MAKIESLMPKLGSKAPAFSLMDVTSGKQISLSENAEATLIMFICNHCPFVKHVNKALTQLANDYQPRDVQFIAISSNDIHAYPEDSPEKMRETAKAENYPFPYLFDETQAVAKAYQAACTPDFFLYDGELHLAYRGQLDDSRPGNAVPVSGQSIRRALDDVLAGRAVDEDQKPGIGCSIKWKD